MTSVVQGWVRTVTTEPAVFNSVLSGTGSFLSGEALYHTLTTKDTSQTLEVYATAEGAKLLIVFFVDMYISVRFLEPIEDELDIKCGIGAVVDIYDNASSHLLKIYVCRTPMETIRVLPVNLSQVYFDGTELNASVLKEEPRLLEYYILDYLRFSAALNETITFFADHGVSIAVNIRQRHVGKHQRPKPTRQEQFKKVTYDIYNFIHMHYMDLLPDFPGYICVIDSCLYEFTYTELKQNLGKVAQLFLPEGYQGDVNKLIDNAILDLYQSESTEGKVLLEQYYGINTDKSLASIVQHSVSADSARHKKKLYINSLTANAQAKDRLSALALYASPTRRLSNLEFFTRPSSKPVDELAYDEKREQKCFDLDSLSYYDINAYLRGEEVIAYDQDGKQDELERIPAVPASIARKRLVFFVASDDKLTRINPFCYNLEHLEKDLSTRLYSDSCQVDEKTGDGLMGDINRGFSNPLFKLAFDTNVYVRLRKLLKALYQTKSQAFLLIPTAEVAPRTASLSAALYQLSVSGDHCQAGTDKRVYRIVVCGKGSDKCYPLRGDIEFQPDSVTRASHTDYGAHLLRYAEEIEAARESQNLTVLADDELDIFDSGRYDSDSDSGSVSFPDVSDQDLDNIDELPEEEF